MVPSGGGCSDTLSLDPEQQAYLVSALKGTSGESQWDYIKVVVVVYGVVVSGLGVWWLEVLYSGGGHVF